MQDNTKRANRVLFWMKVVIVLLFVLWFIPLSLFVFGSLAILTEFDFVQSIMRSTSGFWYLVGILMIILRMFWIFALLGAIFVFCIRYLSWLYRAVSNLRLLTTTSFSPVVAVLLTCIPFFGYFLNYFIFSDMVKRQERYMEQHGVLKERFPKEILNVWFIASLVLLILVFVDPDQLGLWKIVYTMIDYDASGAFNFGEKTLILIIPILYIKSFSAYIKQERELFQFRTEELFNKHVDEVIREREILRAAEKLRKSKGLESSQTNQEE